MKKIFYLVFSVLALSPALVLAHAGEENYNNMMDWHWGNNSMMGGSFGVLAFITWLVWLVVGVLAIVWLWQKINRK